MFQYSKYYKEEIDWSVLKMRFFFSQILEERGEGDSSVVEFSWIFSRLLDSGLGTNQEENLGFSTRKN